LVLVVQVGLLEIHHQIEGLMVKTHLLHQLPLLVVVVVEQVCLVSIQEQVVAQVVVPLLLPEHQQVAQEQPIKALAVVVAWTAETLEPVVVVVVAPLAQMVLHLLVVMVVMEFLLALPEALLLAQVVVVVQTS
jgi:hypothetical protein